ncbi:HdeD family acid-resistance protein [Rhodomicrobium lacus]|uniref:HdeD family acid-resistance protein n=1 Tax=Rhodomicrobium lacus TaxID=2498452 RepID=UPI0026E3AE65|nr:HdeD family acid-resistance protein [Rhodomicrobium lacus]WKW51736.1 HdeD family acid-resistance protein [Rhodomicrobium lacus]
MSSTSSDLNVPHQREREVIHDHWILFLIQGLLLAVLGILAIGAPYLTTVVAVKLAGWLFIIGGIIGLATFFTGREVPGSIWSFLGAALAIAVGVYLLRQPLVGVLSLTLVLAAFFLAQGITQIFAALSHRRVLSSWGWLLFSGLVDLILAGIIISGFPLDSAWVLGILVGVYLLLYGIALIMTALASRDVSPEQFEYRP